jgi:hypothetical protein
MDALQISRDYKKQRVDEKLLAFTSLDIGTLKRHMETVAGNWDGDNPHGEEPAQCALDIIKKCEELTVLLQEMANY